jgi:uncharacterized membrane protein YcaP (DUF421 family)
MDIALRAAAIFIALYVLMRLMGKRELGQMTPFELIVLVVIGDLIQQGVTQNDFSVTGAIIAISTIAFLALVMSWATYLWPWAEKALEGEPRVIVQDGEIVTTNLRRNRLTETEIESEMRLAGIGRLADVAWGILEPRGKISFIQRSESGSGESPPPNPPNTEDDGAA